MDMSTIYEAVVRGDMVAAESGVKEAVEEGIEI